MLLIDNDIAQPSEGRVIGHDSRESDEGPVGSVGAGIEAVSHGLFNDLAADSRRPVRRCKHAMEPVHVEPGGVEIDLVVHVLSIAKFGRRRDCGYDFDIGEPRGQKLK